MHKFGSASLTLVDLRVAIANGWLLVPRDGEWWGQFALTTGVVGITVGWVSFGCAIVATPVGPAFVALASGACAVAGSHLGIELVKVGYERVAGVLPSDSALKAGRLAGITIGTIGAAKVVEWEQFWRFKNYAGYAHEARNLTRQSLGPLRPQIQALRGAFYDIDHVIPVKCGWALRIPPERIGSLPNLQALPASINRSIGTKGR